MEEKDLMYLGLQRAIAHKAEALKIFTTLNGGDANWVRNRCHGVITELYALCSQFAELHTEERSRLLDRYK